MAVGWEGRTVLWELIRRADLAGVVDESEPRIIAELCRLPLDVVDRGLPALLERGVVIQHNDAIVIPNYEDAQTATYSAAERQRRFRERKKAIARRNELLRDVTSHNEKVTGRNANGTNRDGQNAPRSGAYLTNKKPTVTSSGQSDAEKVLTASGAVTTRNKNVQNSHTVQYFLSDVASAPDLSLPESDKESEPKTQGAKATSPAPAGGKALARSTADRFVRYLNAKAGRRYRLTDSVVSAVRARIAEGATDGDFKACVDSRVREWATDENMSKHLRPTTLLRKSHFFEYVEAASRPGLGPQRRNGTHAAPRATLESLGIEVIRK